MIDLSKFKQIHISKFKAGMRIFATVSDLPRITFNIRFCDIAESTKWRVLTNDKTNELAIVFLPENTKEQGIATVRKIGKNSTHCFHNDFIKLFREMSHYNGITAIRVFGKYYPEEHCVIFNMEDTIDAKRYKI